MTTTAENLADALFRQEELLPELRPYRVPTELGECIKHPLVFSIIHHDQLNALVNAQFKVKSAAVAKALTDREWGYYLAMHEKPYRLQAFIDIRKRLAPKEYWELLADTWVTVENLHEYKAWLPKIMETEAPAEGRQAFMDSESLAVFQQLPDEFDIFRGYHDGGTRLGWSWTTSPSKATWFARRFQSHERKPHVITGEVQKSAVIGILLGRGEAEVVVNPRRVRNRREVILEAPDA